MPELRSSGCGSDARYDRWSTHPQGFSWPGGSVISREEKVAAEPTLACVCPAAYFQERNPFSVLMIRLSRRGARKQPYYRIVVIEKDRARDGRSVEVVGTYNPRTNPASVELKRERIDYWTSKGAQLSDRVRKLVEKAPANAPAPTAA